MKFMYKKKTETKEETKVTVTYCGYDTATVKYKVGKARKTLNVRKDEKIELPMADAKVLLKMRHFKEEN